MLLSDNKKYDLINGDEIALLLSFTNLQTNENYRLYSQRTIASDDCERYTVPRCEKFFLFLYTPLCKRVGSKACRKLSSVCVATCDTYSELSVKKFIFRRWFTACPKSRFHKRCRLRHAKSVRGKFSKETRTAKDDWDLFVPVYFPHVSAQRHAAARKMHRKALFAVRQAGAV